MNEGLVSTKLGLAGIPSLCEEVMLFRDLRLAELTGGRLHLAHISTKESVEHIGRAKAQGLKVTAEVTPHHLFLTDEAVIGYNTNTKMNPPLRTEMDRQALIKGLLEGTIDVLASDHAPHSLEEKEDDYNTAPFGIVGLETSLGLVLTELVNTGMMDWAALILRMAVKPREILHLPAVKIAEGNEAELTIIDPEAEWVVEPEKFKSLSRNTPFKGRRLKGRAYGIYNRGQLILNY
jgi:dihydroorotase